MKIRSLLVAALPAALLLCTLPTSGSPAQSSTATLSRAAAEEYYVIIHYRDQAELQRIAGRFQHPRIDRQAKTIKVAIDAHDMADLRRMGVRMDIDRNRTSRLRSMAQALRNGRFGARALSDFACYRTVENTHSAMTALQTSKPTLAKVLNLGPTWKKWSAGGTNGYEMQVLRITNSATDAIRPNKPAMVLLSSIHAREYAPAEFNMRFGEWLVNGHGTDAEATWLLDNYVFYLIPQGNPDGRKIAENGTLWRKNINNTNGSCAASKTGVDLNRNFPFHWGTLDDGPTSSNACVETYRGPSSASEQETQNIMRLIAGTPGASGSYTGGIFTDRRASGLSSAAPDDTQGVFIDLHSYSGEVLWPWGMVNSLAPNHTGLQTLGRRMAYYNKYSPYQSVKFYPTAGSTDDTMYGELGVPSYTWELGSNAPGMDSDFFQPCSSFLSTILPDNLNALKYTARILTRPYRYPAGPETVSVSAAASSAPANKSITVAAGTPVTITAVLDDGVWGQIVHTPPDPTQRIASARAYIDTPPWEAGASGGIAMTASDGSFSTARETVTATISTAGLSVGRHLVYVQGVDASGEAGAPNAVLLNITSGGGGGGSVLSNGVAVTGLSGAQGAELRYTLQAPAGATGLNFITSGGSGDADLYIKFGSAPTTAAYDLRSWNDGTNSETINVAVAQAGTYHVLVRGYAAFSGASLTGSYTTGGGTSMQTYTNATAQTLAPLATINSDIVVSGRTGNGRVDSKIAVDITHTYRGDVVIDLIAPNGVVIPLKSSAADSADDVKVTYTKDLSAYALNGTWRLRVRDVDQADSGRLNSWSITF
jgi:carboxypeptidase T